MKFLNQKNVHQPSPIQVQDYIDSSVLEALPNQQQHLLNRIIFSDSKYLDKFFNKLSSNQVFLNTDMLEKMLEMLTTQMALPLKVLHNNSESDTLSFFNIDQETHDVKLDIWLSMLQNLNIWSTYPLSTIRPYLRLAHQYIISDLCPPFNEKKPQASRMFWPKKQESNDIGTEVMFKFIYNKLKHFHWEHVPNTKRSMDLFELYCPIEDTALDKNIVTLKDEQSEFLRSLHASALLYSVVYNLPAALPDFVATYLEHVNEFPQPLWEHIKDDPSFEPFYGQHHYLSNLNCMAFYLTLSQLIQSQRNPNSFLIDLATQAELMDAIEQDYQGQTGRFIFIFNRLTSLGFLMRSPLLKALGFHPVVNTEVPAKFINNLRLFLNQFRKLSPEQQQHITEEMIQMQPTCQERTNSFLVDMKM